MGDVAKGIKSFKKGMKEELEDPEQIDESTEQAIDGAIDVTPKKEEKA
jgi:Sec-independent protein translocase protein TatA